MKRRPGEYWSQSGVGKQVMQAEVECRISCQVLTESAVSYLSAVIARLYDTEYLSVCRSGCSEGTRPEIIVIVRTSV
jgi:hypothetical protein